MQTGGHFSIHAKRPDALRSVSNNRPDAQENNTPSRTEYLANKVEELAKQLLLKDAKIEQLTKVGSNSH